MRLLPEEVTQPASLAIIFRGGCRHYELSPSAELTIMVWILSLSPCFVCMQAREHVSAGGGAASNMIHFKVTRYSPISKKIKWTLSMEKPPYFLVYLLRLAEIEAETAYAADKYELSLHGTTLGLLDRLCTAGVEDGDVLMLKVCTVSR